MTHVYKITSYTIIFGIFTSDIGQKVSQLYLQITYHYLLRNLLVFLRSNPCKESYGQIKRGLKIKYSRVAENILYKSFKHCFKKSMELISKLNVTCRERIGNTFKHCKMNTANDISDFLIAQNHLENKDFSMFLE